MKDNATNIVLNVHLKAVPGKEEHLLGLLSALVEPTRGEAGCIAYELHRDLEDPGRFMFYERFASQEALDAHAAAPHFQHFVATRAAANPDPVESQAVTKWRAIA